jgi:ABC-type polar amino acid transport system ATPase subunit
MSNQNLVELVAIRKAFGDNVVLDGVDLSVARGEVVVIADLARDGMTMLVVTHEMGFAREVCDRLVFIDGGLIVEEGPPAEFFANARSERAREFVDKIIHHYGELVCRVSGG